MHVVRSIAVRWAAPMLLAAPLAAQQPAAGDTIGLAQAVALARTANPMLAARTAEVRASGARIAPAGAFPDPVLTFGAMNYMLPDLSPRGDPMTMNQLTLMQMVPVNGSRGLRRTSARQDSSALAAGRDAAQLALERDVRHRFWELYHTDRALEVMRRTLGVMRDLNDITRSMYGVGSAMQADVLRAQVAVTRLQQEIAEMQLRRVQLSAGFNALLGRPGDAPVRLPDPGTAHSVHVLMLPEPPVVDSLLALADSANPEIGARRFRVSRAETEQRLARRMLMPDVRIGASYGQRAGVDDMVSVMIGASLPLFAGSRQLEMRRETEAMLEAARRELESARVEARAELVAARQEAETARGLVELYASSLLPQAQATYEASLAAYRVGRADFPTVLEAQNALLMYEHDLHGYEAMYGFATADIDRLIGRPYGQPVTR